MSHEIGDRIIQARRRAGLSAAGLADRVGVRPVQVWRWEKRGSVPKSPVLQRIASACGVSMEWLIDDEQHAETQQIAS